MTDGRAQQSHTEILAVALVFVLGDMYGRASMTVTRLTVVLRFPGEGLFLLDLCPAQTVWLAGVP